MLDSYGTRRQLPHLQRAGATYYVTFCTHRRWILPDAARDITLATILREHTVTCWLECAVIMPDHVHLVAMPYDTLTFPKLMQRLKSISSHRINREAEKRGRIWQEESFDRIVRSEESARAKAEYVMMNPVRKGLCATADEYPWLWRVWVDG